MTSWTLKTFERLPKEWGPPLMMFKVLARDSRLLQRYVGGAVSYLDPSHVTLRQREVFLLRVACFPLCVGETFIAEMVWRGGE